MGEGRGRRRGCVHTKGCDETRLVLGRALVNVRAARVEQKGERATVETRRGGGEGKTRDLLCGDTRDAREGVA
jgi:hypothetical protein